MYIRRSSRCCVFSGKSCNRFNGSIQQRRAATRSRRCAGRAKARARSRLRCCEVRAPGGRQDGCTVCLAQGIPFISVDTKKKELVGDFKNAGREWQPKSEPEGVDVHDFPGDAVGKAIPYGVYDVAANNAFVTVGVDHDTPVFAVTSIETWWELMGSKRYPGAKAISSPQWRQPPGARSDYLFGEPRRSNELYLGPRERAPGR
jgi:hypothetical protein